MVKGQSYVGILLFWAVICITITSTHGLYCQVCQEISHARDCNEIKKCSSTSICYHDKIRTASGSIRRRLGCRDKLVTIPTSSSVLCSETCSTDMCSVSLCGDQGYATPRGPLCFRCDKLRPDDCNQFLICGRDQICYESAASSSGTGDVLVSAGCYGKQACQTILSMFGRRRRQSTPVHYYNCCHDDLCNHHNFSDSVTTTTLAPTVNHVTSGTTCTDHSSADVCQLAARLVCSDRDKAANAGCLKHCGFCSHTGHASTVSPTSCTDITELSICQVAGQYVCNDRDKASHAGCPHFCGFC